MRVAKRIRLCGTITLARFADSRLRGCAHTGEFGGRSFTGSDTASQPERATHS
jgi:hypothetical protein